MIDFILNHMPIGLKELIIAGVFSEAMSSIDSLLNSMSAVFIKDIYEPITKKEASLKNSMISSTAIECIMIIYIYIYIDFNATTKSILDVVGACISYFSDPACAMFILGFFSIKANDKNVASACVLALFMTFFISLKLHTTWMLNPFIGCFITLILGFIFFNARKTQKRADLFYLHKNEKNSNLILK